jgi:hypothetical protein
MGGTATTSPLIKQYDPPLIWMKILTIDGINATARAAVQKNHWLPCRVTNLLIVECVQIRNL